MKDTAWNRAGEKSGCREEGKGTVKKEKNRKDQRKAWKRELRKVRKELKKEQKKRVKKQSGKNTRKKQTEEKTETGKQEECYDLPYTRAAKEMPIASIRDGILYTTDGRYVKILEALPINFLHRSASEQRNICLLYTSMPGA